MDSVVVIRVIAGVAVFCVCIALAVATTAKKTPLKPGIEGWLFWFVVRFYISAVFWLAGAAEHHSTLYLAVGIIELVLGVLLSMKHRIGLILTRIWMILQSLVFGLLAMLAFMPPASEAEVRSLAYSIGAAIIAVYFFRSQRVKLTYPRT